MVSIAFAMVSNDKEEKYSAKRKRLHASDARNLALFKRIWRQMPKTWGGKAVTRESEHDNKDDRVIIQEKTEEKAESSENMSYEDNFTFSD